MARVRRILIATPVPGKSGWTPSHLNVLRMHNETHMDAIEDDLRQRLSIPEEDGFEFILADAAWNSAGSAIGRRSSRFEEWNEYVATGADGWGDPNFDVVLVPGGPNWPGEHVDYCVGKATGFMIRECIMNNKPVYILRRDEVASGSVYFLDPRPLNVSLEDEDSWTRFARLLTE